MFGRKKTKKPKKEEEASPPSKPASLASSTPASESLPAAAAEAQASGTPPPSATQPGAASPADKSSSESRGAAQPQVAGSSPSKRRPHKESAPGSPARQRALKVYKETSAGAADEVGRKLMNRRSTGELFGRNVLKRPGGGSSSVSNALVGVATQLGRTMTSNRVEQLLEGRPEPRALVASNIISVDVAPMVQQARMKLSRQMMRDNVAHLLQTRPDKSDLVGAIVPRESRTVAPALQANMKKLSFKLSKDLLGRSLESRPEMAEVARLGILRPPPPLEAAEDEEEGVEEGGDDDREGEDADPTVQRQRLAVALKGASALAQRGTIDVAERSRLKDLILDFDDRVLAAVKVWELDHDLEEMLDTLARIAATTTS